MDIKIFALGDCKNFGEQVCAYLSTVSTSGKQIKLSTMDERTFQDGEVYCASQENVRGSDVFVIQSCYTDAKETINDKLMKLLIFIGSLRDAKAGRITAVLPYYPYGRQDRKTGSRTPISTKYLAGMFHSMSADHVLTMDAHNSTAVQNDFPVEWRFGVDILEANGLFAQYLAQELKSGNFGDDWYQYPIVAMSPDSGGLGRTRKARSILERYLGMPVDIACLDKIHNHDTGKAAEIRANGFLSSVSLKDKWMIIYDDMISSGKTVLESAQAARAAGARGVLAVCATNGLFVGNANEYLDNDFIHKIVITDTIKPWRITNPRVQSKIDILSATELFGEAIRRTHRNESISDLIENGAKADAKVAVE